MTKVRLNLAYPELSKLIQEQTNKQKLEFRSYPIAIDNLNIEKKMDLLVISSDIISKWNAGFVFTMTPQYIKEEKRLEIKNLDISFETKNLIFKGLLKIAKNMILSRIEKMAEEPLEKHLNILKSTIDKEIENSKLPFDLDLISQTKSITIEVLEFRKNSILIHCELDNHLQINLYDVKGIHTIDNSD